MGIEQLTWNTILETYWKLISCNFVTQILIFYYLVNCLCFYWNRKRPSKFQIRLNQEGNMSYVKGLHHQVTKLTHFLVQQFFNVKELSLELRFFNFYIVAIQCPLIFQTMNSVWSNKVWNIKGLHHPVRNTRD